MERIGMNTPDIAPKSGRAIGATDNHNTTPHENAVFCPPDYNDCYRFLFNNMIDGVSLNCISGHNSIGPFLDVNEALCCQLGYSRSELLAMVPADLYSMPAETVQREITEFKNVKHKMYDIPVKLRNGQHIPMDIACHFFEIDGKPHVLSILRNVTERKKNELKLFETEKRFRDMFETSADGIAMLDQDGNIVDCNMAFIDLFGYLSREELLYRRFCDIVPPRYEDSHAQTAEATSGIRASYTCEQKCMRKNGEHIFVNMRRWHQYDAGNLPVGQWITIRDITEKKRMDARILKSQRLESLSKLGGGIAHDFNNLLSGIFGYIDMARISAKEFPDRTDSYLSRALGLIDNAKRLTQRFLTFSEGGTPVKSLCSIGDIVKDTTTLSLAGKNVCANLSIPDDLQPCEVDPAQISQVISNIIMNALSAMPDGGTIWISAENLEKSSLPDIPESGEFAVMISIRDTGKGIPESMVSKVFDPFVTSSYNKSGLGLTICQSIIRQHNGYMSLMSQMGKGTEVRIFLPSADAPPADTKETPNRASVNQRRILVMDDESFVLEIAGEMLSNLGCHVETAPDSEMTFMIFKKALEQNEPFDVVILDLTIPGGAGGVKTCEKIRSIDSEVKIIASSGYSIDPVMASPEQYGFNAILNKPYLMSELYKVLGTVLSASAPIS